MKCYDKQRCLETILKLASKKGMKIGDLESKAGISAGYLSRMNKPDNKTNMTIDTLDALADALDVSINYLITGSPDKPAAAPIQFEEVKAPSQPTESDKYVIDFINGMIKKTEEGVAIWDRTSALRLINMEANEWNEVSHPLFKGSGIASQRKAVYFSDFKPEKRFKVTGDGFNVRLDNQSMLFLMDVAAIEKDGDVPYYEMYIVQGDYVAPICQARQNSKDMFCQSLSKLYSTVVANSYHVNIDKSVKRSMDNYLAE